MNGGLAQQNRDRDRDRGDALLVSELINVWGVRMQKLAKRSMFSLSCPLSVLDVLNFTITNQSCAPNWG